MLASPAPLSGNPLVASVPRAQIARIGVLVALFYALVLPIITKDVGYYYGPWLDHIWAAGPIAAFAKPFGNYTPPYLYLLALLSPLKLVLSDAAVIKSVSLVGNALLALAMGVTLKRLGTGNGAIGALAVVALPSAILNAALLGQCDALYVAPIVMAAGAAATRRPGAMLAWFGFALSIKLQAILCAPFFLAMLLAWRKPLWRWWPAPAAFIAAMLPAWTIGWPGSDLATIYLRQARDLDGIFLNAPNIWTIAELAIGSASGFFTLAIAAACAASLAYLVWMRQHAVRFSQTQLLNAALLAPLLTAGLLPRMHERYFFAADILALLLALAAPARNTTMLVVLVQLGSCLAMLGYLTGADLLAALAAVPMLVATAMVTRSLITAHD